MEFLRHLRRLCTSVEELGVTPAATDVLACAYPSIVRRLARERPWEDVEFVLDDGVDVVFRYLLAVQRYFHRVPDEILEVAVTRPMAVVDAMLACRMEYVTHNDTALSHCMAMMALYDHDRGHWLHRGETRAALQTILRRALVPVLLHARHTMCPEGARTMRAIAASLVGDEIVRNSFPDEEETGTDPSPHVCPITLSPAFRPVVASDGHVYEHAAIIEHMSNRLTSPMTREPLDVHLAPLTSATK